MKYKLICSDLDDTLIGSDGKYGRGLKNAIKDYEERGGIFCIVTGRMTAGALPLASELGLKNELATFQGAVISDLRTGKVLSETVISCEKAVEIGKYIESKGYYYQTYDGDKFYTATPNDFTVLYGKLSHAEFAVTEEKLSVFIGKKKLNPPKILLMDDAEKIPAILEDLRGKFGKDFLINTSKPFIVEIIPHGTDKGVAVAFIADRHGISREEIVCVGDSENDVPMLKYAGVGVCVGSGSAKAKEAADDVAPGCDDDPVTWVINKYGK